MGYYTRHELRVYPQEKWQEVCDAFVRAVTYSIFDQPIGWYSYIEDCIEVSQSIPDAVIVINGQGEDYGDVWVKAFFRGELIWYWGLDCTVTAIPADILQGALDKINAEQSANQAS